MVLNIGIFSYRVKTLTRYDILQDDAFVRIVDDFCESDYPLLMNQ